MRDDTRQKLFYLCFAFVFMWTLGEVFEVKHRENLVQTICITISYGIYLGLHSIAWNQIKTLFGKTP